MKSTLGLSILLLLINFSLFAQINFSANDFGHVPVYNGYFQYGINFGWYGSSWDDNSLSDIAAGNPYINVKGAGAKSLHLTLTEDFLEQWGYDIRTSQFNHYATIGVKDITLFLEHPSTAHRDYSTFDGCTDPSMMFKNMYSPIWDGGANGTPVNDTNYFALYIYKTVNLYKTNVKFWEVINEPDYDASASHGWQDPGAPGNWWDNNPQACDLANLKAPVFRYLRLLRIAYEVIKYLDPNAYVAPGGLGYASFLDAMLRNTDNPVDGSVTSDYPLKGGAYFDVLSFHCYPMYALRSWDNGINGFIYKRHSDAAVDEFIKLKNKFDSVLISRGYNNVTYPSKYFILTESNLPRKQISDFIGSEDAQKNYIIKAQVASQINNIVQYYTFVLGDAKNDNEATDPYQLMGLYKKLEGIGPLANGGNYLQQYNNSGIANKTASDLLRYKRYDVTRTALLSIPAGINGAAFKDSLGNYMYVLWARTTTDQSEIASLNYTFPPSLYITQVKQYSWDYSSTGITNVLSGINIPLSATPVFLEQNLQLFDLHDDSSRNRRRIPANEFEAEVFPNPAGSTASLQFNLLGPMKISVELYDEKGLLISKLIQGNLYTSGKHILPLSISKLSSGIYYLRLISDEVNILRKLMISR